MSDLISREAAIDAIEELKNRYLDRKVVLAKAQDAVNNLPTAEKEGKWIRMYYSRPKQYTRICSECGEICWFCGIGDYNYCQWCGARMEGEEG